MEYTIRNSAELIGLLKLWDSRLWKVSLQNDYLNDVDITPRIYMNFSLGSVVVLPSRMFIARFYAPALRPGWRKRLYVPPKPYEELKDSDLFEAELRAFRRRRGGFYVYDIVCDRSIAAQPQIDPQGYGECGGNVGFINFRMPLVCHQSLNNFFGRA